MRQKLAMAAFVLLLVAVWGVGFLWFRGDLDLGSDTDKLAASGSSASAEPSPSSSPSTSPRPDPAASPSVSPAAVPSYTGRVTAAEEAAEERRAADSKPVAPRPKPAPLPPVATFSMATFNMLGSSHTRPGGHHAYLPSGPQRIGGSLNILAQHDVSVAGLQEFQPDQRAAFQRQARGWQAYPGTSTGGGAGENSVIWRTDTWELVTPGTVPIPYFNGRIRPMPYVLLRHRQTKVQAYFSTFHNPANTKNFRGQQKFRNAATSREIELFNRLERTGVPQFVTGDMNERDEYFCRVTGATPLVAAAGGSNIGGCAPPQSRSIDWIFGSPGAQFSGYGIDRSPLVRRTTDHPVIHTNVTIDATKFENAFSPEPAPAP